MDSQAATLVVDPTLQSVLAAADRTRQQCLELLSLLDSQKNRDAQGDLVRAANRQQRAVVSHLAKVRRLHRQAVVEMRATKQETAEAKNEVDTLHLQLQNVIYIQGHLGSEIAGCENYDHKYLSLPLISEEDYLSSQPDTSPDADPHVLMLARIEHEHSVRQSLEEKRQGLLKRKQTLIAANNKRKENLASLDRELEKFIEAAEPISKTFERGLVPGDAKA